MYETRSIPIVLKVDIIDQLLYCVFVVVSWFASTVLCFISVVFTLLLFLSLIHIVVICDRLS